MIKLFIKTVYNWVYLHRIKKEIKALSSVKYCLFF